MQIKKHFRGLIVAGMVGANALVVALAVYALLQSKHQYEARTQVLAQNVAVAIDSNLTNAIAKIDLALKATVDELERELAAGGIREAEITRFIARQEERLPELEAIRVSNADGRVILGKGLTRQEKVSWADREYFITLRDNPEAGLQISKPRVGRVAKKAIIGLGRRYRTPDGRFAGVVSAPIAVDYLNTMLTRYDVGSNGTLVLRDADVGLITRHPTLSGPVGMIGDTTVSPELREIIKTGTREAFYHTRTSADGYERSVAFRRIEAVNMLLAVAIDRADYLADWRREIVQTGGLVACFFLLSLGAGGFLIKLVGRMVEEVEDRQRLESMERRFRASHQRLNEVAANAHLPLPDQLHQALTVGAEHLGMEFGLVSRIAGDEYRLVAQVSPPGTLQDGQVLATGDMVCSLTLRSSEVLALRDLRSMPQAADWVSRGVFLPESYIGVALSVDGKQFGTLCFSSAHRDGRDFDDGDKEFIRLLARWVASAIERDIAQKRLIDSELRLQTIVDTEPECVKIVAPDGRLVQMNRAGLTMLEVDAAAEVIGQPVVEVVAPEFRTAFLALGRRVLAGDPGALEFEIVGRRGGRRWVETNAVPMRDAEGAITGILAVTRDVTLRRQAEQALAQAKNAAEEANRAKSQFLATMSHEIRTPLNGILGMAQLLLLSDLTSEERDEYARVILRSGETLLTLLNDILDLSKVEAGRVELDQSAFAPEQLIRDVATLFAEPIQAKGIALSTVWSGEGSAHYRGDPMRIRQMLSNLLSNAVKFTEAGSIVVQGREVARDDQGALLEISVSDTGIGVPIDKLEMLFKPFSQVDGSITRKYGGTGLGLSIVRSLAELMGGESGLESQEGKGTRAWFRVRVRRAEADSLAVKAAPRPERPAFGTGGYVLVVEDNDTNRRLLEAMLRKLGVAHCSVTDGRQAVDFLTGGEHSPPMLVLMDCQMPILDGYGATTELRAWEAARGIGHTPIVALTASAFPEDRARCFAVGMDDFIAKPLAIRDLVGAIERWGAVPSGRAEA